MISVINELRNKADILLKENNDKLINVKLSLIRKILNDEGCFFKMTMSDALNILSDLKYSRDESLRIYKEMVSSQEYLKYEQ